jgi:hypothetical protein
MTDFQPTTSSRPVQYYDITGWSFEDINKARRAGHLEDFLAGRPAPTDNTDDQETAE